MKPIHITLAVAASIMLSGITRGQDSKPVRPTFAMQLKSVDGLMYDAKYIAKLMGRGDQVDQFDGLVAAFAGPNGLSGSGLDVGRPFLVYAIAKPTVNELPVFAVMVPVSDEGAFLKLLETLNVKSESDNDGIRTVELPNPPVSLHFKFSNKYAYFTAQSKSNLNAQNIVPADLVTMPDPNLVLGARLQIDQIPDEIKNLALGQIELRLAAIKDRKNPDETPEQARMRRTGIDGISQAIKYVLSEGKALEFNVSVDRKSDDLGMSLSLDGKPNTTLATIISMLGSGKTRFVPNEEAAMHFGLNAAVPDMFRPFIGGIIDVGFGDLMAREPDAGKKDMAKKLMTAVTPTLKAGEVDMHVAIGGPNADGHFSMLAGLGVRQGAAIETAVKDVLQNVGSANGPNVELDAATVGDLKLHKVPFPAKNIDAETKRMLGDPNMWAGFSQSAFLVGIGAKAEGTFQSMKTAADAVKAPLLLVEGSIARLSTLDRELPGIEKLAEQVFGKSPHGTDAFRLSVNGGDKLKVAASIKGLALKFVTLVNERKAGL